MSFVSCDNSALVIPASYPIGAVGYTFEPSINLTAVASAALLQPMAAYTLPKGVWAVTGVVSVDATVGGQTLTGNTGIAKDAVVVWRSANATAADGVSVSLSCVVSSDGTNVLTIPMTYTSSGAATYGAAAAPLSKIQITRVA